MDHKKRRCESAERMKVTQLSDINYSIEDNENFKIEGAGNTKQWEFDPLTGKVVVSVLVKMDIHNTGVNIATLYSQKGKKLLEINTEGAYFYSYDGNKKCKLSHYNSDDWYSVYITINTNTDTYSLYIDGERQLWNAKLMFQADSLSSLSMGSVGGIIYSKRINIYKNPIQSVSDAAAGNEIWDVKEHGVTADGKTVVTKELQELIDKCADKGGGVIYLQDGIYLSGTIELKENITFYIETDAVLKGVLDIEAYPTQVSKDNPNWNMLVQGPQKSLIYADGKKNVKIIGGGTIDGSGDFEGEYGSESYRPSGILLVGCDDAKICDLYVIDAGMWTIPVVECDNLYIRDINMDSCWYPNRDAIDICDCFDVLIQNCNLKSDDDTICFKSGNESGCDNVLVRNCMIISTMANGIKFGTYSYGGFTNCTVADCIVKDTRTCGINIQSVDGGTIKNLFFENIIIDNVESAFFILIGDKGRVPDWGEHRIGSIENINFKDIEVNNLRRNYGSYLGGFKKDG
ncbi:glycoside hydrolase family 28 protein [Natronospora cellulosivora (SeqCode)]